MHRPQAPEILQIPLAEFDASVLPAGAREPGTPTFEEAVITHHALAYAARGWNALVTVDDRQIHVVAVPQDGIDPKAYVIGLLRNGFLEDALPLLEALDGMLDDAETAYNHGICLSELGRPAEAVEALQHCLALDPAYTNARVGLGVAFSRVGRTAEAEEALRAAIARDPKNVHAKRNLAAVLARSGRPVDALPYFRQAASLAPDDIGSALGLAQCLEQLGGEHGREADRVYAEIIRRFPDHPAAESARTARSQLAQATMHATAQGSVRMDAVYYMQSALDQLSKMPKEQIGKIVMEIALRGREGLSINDPEVRYRLESLAGDFSGLQLLAWMHVGVRMLDPDADTGTGLDREYALATATPGKPA